jgi:hypothetical protein
MTSFWGAVPNEWGQVTPSLIDVPKKREFRIKSLTIFRKILKNVTLNKI